MSRNARKEGFSRRHRFAERGSFGPVLRGPRKIRGRLAMLHVVASHNGLSRMGVALTRRLVPSSTQRNDVKRMAREAFRRHPAKAAGFDCVITLREKLAAESALELRSEIGSLLDRLCQAESR